AADCLETLEEIAEQNREIFLEAGGKKYAYIPALNATPEHIDMRPLSAPPIRRALPPASTTPVITSSRFTDIASFIVGLTLLPCL
ncbi:ferrochelatase, partial [Salmonella enterica subsp. enterica serovar Anatum]|nr:ferrochelatase [Salmonella enterica subsp. enterica serovar Anatum]